MVTAIDLKPLSEETIQQMGYSSHDLWMVKLDSVVFGPYETETLKHYVQENEHLFDSAEASLADETEWKPFWAHTKFQRRKPQIAGGEQYEGPFWLMHQGLKVGPFTLREIDKKIEMDLLGMTDHISIDNGDTWLKIYQVAGFDRRTHSPEELPIAPSEHSFQQARLEVIEKVESPHFTTSEELAELAWQGHETGKVIQFKLEEIQIKQEKSVEVSASMKWAMPTAAAVLVTILSSGYFMMEDETSEVIADAPTEESAPFYKKKMIKKTARGEVPTPEYRKPASVNYQRPEISRSESRYPTHIETHDQYQEPIQELADPIEEPLSDAEQRPQEHSLVTNNVNPEDSSLEGAMGGEPVQQPVVEEASDF